MSKEKETISDIVAEIRTWLSAAYCREREFFGIDPKELANRIEAAFRREWNEEFQGRIANERERDELRIENTHLRAALKNTVDVLNAVGPLVLKHDETCIITLGVGCAINNAKRALQESEAKE